MALFGGTLAARRDADGGFWLSRRCRSGSAHDARRARRRPGARPQRSPRAARGARDGRRGEAGDGREAVALATGCNPTSLVMDIRMPVLDGIAATRELTVDRASATRVLVLTTYDLDRYVYEALRRAQPGSC